jgi:predicted dehydrogenase
MSNAWSAAVAQRKLAVDSGMLISYCHQRRTFSSAAETKRLMESGAIGDVQRLEGRCSNLYDWGTHWFDMCEFLAGDVDAEWVLAQADRQNVRTVFDQPVDKAGVSVVRYSNGHTAMLITGEATHKGAEVRIVGSAGELRLNSDAKENAITLINKDGITHPSYEARGGIEPAVQHCIECARAGKPSLLDSENALRATEQIFASYLSSQRGERVTLPLAHDGLELPLSGFFTVA